MDIQLKQGENFKAYQPVKGLPELPNDELQRFRSWVVLLSAPELHYTNQGDTKPTRYPITPAFIDKQVALYAQMCGESYTAPVIHGHDEESNPERQGDILCLARWQDPIDGHEKLIAAVAWADPEAEAKIARGAIKYTSGGWGSMRDEKGNETVGVLRHLGIVCQPHNLNIDAGRRRHILQQGIEMENSEVTLASLHAMMVALSARVDLMQKDEDESDDEDESTPPPKPEDEEELEMSQDSNAPELSQAQMAQQLAAANRRIEELHQFNASYPVGHSVVLTEDLRKVCFDLMQADFKAFDALCRQAKAASVTPPPRSPDVRNKVRTLTWGSEVQASNHAGVVQTNASPKTVEVTPETAEEMRRELSLRCAQAHPDDPTAAWNMFETQASQLGLLDV